jgi:hypothetical protein
MKKALVALGIALSPFWVLAQVQGTYKLVLFDVLVDNVKQADYFGAAPSGYLIVTPTRLMTIITKEGRKRATSGEEKAALVDTLIAYTGPYRIEGKKLTTAVDVSWSEVWTGTQQSRTWTVEGNHLTLVTDPAPYTRDPTKTATARLVWEKIE